MNKNHLIYLFLFVLILVFSCKKEEFTTESTAKLAFSIDTVMFDTVFTTIGSTTKQFKVYNNNNKSINISSIYLAGGNTSNFRLNIDGQRLNSLSNIDILPNDSLYIFVEVTVDPNGVNSPIMIQDSIVFFTNGNMQDIDLVAVGQDVHFINGQYVGTETWTNDKPYLVYNSMAVDTLETLTIEAGTQIHFHRNSNLVVIGTLIVNGTIEEPVVFQGDRLEEIYDDVPGQWGVIALTDGSLNNRIDHAIIKNGIVGIQVGVYNATIGTNLFISNTKIENMTYAGLYMFNSSSFVSNCVISNCGYYATFMAVHGFHRFYHCTIANYFGYANRIDPSVLVSNNLTVDDHTVTGDMDVYYGNSIIYGNNLEEIGTSYHDNGTLTYKFENCITRVRTDDEASFLLDLTDTSHFVEIINNEDPSFKDINEYNFELDTLSIAKDAGSISITNEYDFLEYDILGQSRLNDSQPDPGAYERIE